MSSRSNTKVIAKARRVVTSRTATGKKPIASNGPLLGALLRIAHEEVTQSMLNALRAEGIELSVTEYRVLRYPGPDGMRPVDLAERCNLTRQAMNYVLAGLTAKGFIERRAAAGKSGRLIFATARGWEVFAALRRSVEAVERDWAAHLGAQRMKELSDTLHELAVRLGKIEPAAAQPTALSTKNRARRSAK